MTKKLKTMGICSVFILTAGGFVGYEKAQARAFLDKFDWVVEGLSHEQDYHAAMDRYRTTLLQLSEANPVAIKQAFFEIDHIPDTPEQLRMNQIRRAVGYTLLCARTRHQYVDEWVFGSGGDYPWVRKFGELHIQYDKDFHPDQDDPLSKLWLNFEEYGRPFKPNY